MNKEILKSLLAVRVNSQTQVPPDPDAQAQRLAGDIKKRPAARSSSSVLMRRMRSVTSKNVQQRGVHRLSRCEECVLETQALQGLSDLM